MRGIDGFINCSQDRITNLINDNDLNVSKLSTLAGISRSTLSKFLSGQRKYIRLDIIEYICEGLNIKLVDFSMMKFLMILMFKIKK